MTAGAQEIDLHEKLLVTFSARTEHMNDAPSMHVIVADEDGPNRSEVVSYLEDNGIQTTAVAARSDLFRSIDLHDPDVVILEKRFGSVESLDLLPAIRTKSAVPVILVGGGAADEGDRVIGLETGADDYLSRPLALRELLARTRAVIRRRDIDYTQKPRSRYRRYRFADWLFDQRERRLERIDGTEQPLTNTEFALLSAFVVASGKALSREHLLRVTRRHDDISDRSIDVQVLRLRRKLDDGATNKKLIRSERGVGYLFDIDVRLD